MLCRVRQAFGDNVVGSDLEVLRKPGQSVNLQLHLQRGNGDERLEGNGQPVPTHDGGMQTPSHIPQFVQ